MKRSIGRGVVAAAGLMPAVAVTLVSVVNIVYAEQYVAGVDPSQRPQGAPVVAAPLKGADWQATALRGVSDPKPASLKFLDDQGGWYTPFNRPGMPGYYDIRGLHGGKR